jgi:hypothetical protein
MMQEKKNLKQFNSTGHFAPKHEGSTMAKAPVKKKTQLVIFNEIAPAEFIKGLEEKYPVGLYLDLDELEQRTFAKGEVKSLKEVIAKINRVRIDAKKAYGLEVDQMAGDLIQKIEKASVNITILLDEFKEKRKAELKKENDLLLQVQYEDDFTLALLMDEVESLRAEKAKRGAADALAKAEEEKQDDIKKQAKIQADRLVEVAEENRKRKAILDGIAERQKKEAEQAIVDARKNDVNHRREVNVRACEQLLFNVAGIHPDMAQAVVVAIVKGYVKDISINY